MKCDIRHRRKRPRFKYCLCLKYSVNWASHLISLDLTFKIKKKRKTRWPKCSTMLFQFSIEIMQNHLTESSQKLNGKTSQWNTKILPNSIPGFPFVASISVQWGAAVTRPSRWPVSRAQGHRESWWLGVQCLVHKVGRAEYGYNHGKDSTLSHGKTTKLRTI